MKRTLFLLLPLFVIACAKEGAAPRPAANAAPPRLNLLDIGRGAAVVSRTGEHLLESSAAQAIDGDETSVWSSAVSDVDHTLVFSLPARSRIDGVGAITVLEKSHVPDKLVFETSSDNKTFTPLAELPIKPGVEPQLRNVTPVEARYVRVQVDGNKQFSRLASIIVNGTELEPVVMPRLDGCWTLNEQPLTIVQAGARATGVIRLPSAPILIDGGYDGRVFRFAWVEGPQTGIAMLSISPDAAHVSGLRWHASAEPQHLGESWFANRRPCDGSGVDTTTVMLTFLRGQVPFPLYGLRFDAQDRLMERESEPTLAAIASVITGSQRRGFQFVGREFRGTPEENRQRAQKRLAALGPALQKRGVDLTRVGFIAGGSDRSSVVARTAATHAMHNVIDFRALPAPPPTPR